MLMLAAGPCAALLRASPALRAAPNARLTAGPSMALGPGPLWVGGVCTAGASGAVVVARNLRPWYAGIKKPSWSPPDRVFAPVWTTLYALIGIACSRVFGMSPLAPATRRALVVFTAQGVLNLSWAPIFFGMKRLRAACAVSIALTLAALATVREFALVAGSSTAALLLPYCAWLTFATILNARLWQLNGATA